MAESIVLMIILLIVARALSWRFWTERKDAFTYR
jgi:hypothetical protein